MSAGVSVVKSNEYHGYTPYKRYGRILKIWMANQKYKRRKDISLKLAKHCSVSSRDAVKSIVPYLKVIYGKGNSVDVKFSKEEVEWLEK